mmetsp:Transcript_94392/g.272838  ORF Transcript_94392/g.272838 Transcript_94392/m.272838 type:complete len:251 (+) Transcript_94392:1646-2398(+)
MDSIAAEVVPDENDQEDRLNEQVPRHGQEGVATEHGIPVAEAEAHARRAAHRRQLLDLGHHPNGAATDEAEEERVQQPTAVPARVHRPQQLGDHEYVGLDCERLSYMVPVVDAHREAEAVRSVKLLERVHDDPPRGAEVALQAVDFHSRALGIVEDAVALDHEHRQHDDVEQRLEDGMVVWQDVEGEHRGQHCEHHQRAVVLKDLVHAQQCEGRGIKLGKGLDHPRRADEHLGADEQQPCRVLQDEEGLP